MPLRLARKDAGLQLLQQVRDEAHRFAVSRHRARRQKRTLVSRLDQLAGVGPGRRRALLQRFGSFSGVLAAAVEELRDALGPRLGERVFTQLHPPPSAVEDRPGVDGPDGPAPPPGISTP
jgi:excinuclease ABC subunit C